MACKGDEIPSILGQWEQLQADSPAAVAAGWTESAILFTIDLLSCTLHGFHGVNDGPIRQLGYCSVAVARLARRAKGKLSTHFCLILAPFFAALSAASLR